MSSNNRGKVIRDEYKQDQETYREEIIRKSLEEGHKAISDGDYDYVAGIICDKILPNISLSHRNVRQYHESLNDSELYWSWSDVIQLIEEPRTSDWTHNRKDFDQTELAIYGARNPEESRKDTLTSAFRSIESAAVAEGLVESEFKREIPVFGYEERIGTWWLKAKSYYGQSELGIKHHDMKEFTLMNGKTRSGKSTVLQSEVEDDVAQGNVVIDVHDQIKAENVLYDVEEQRQELIDVREDMGLPVGFDEDYPAPEVEVYVPMTTDTEGKRVSYNTETEEYTAIPFVIPASEIPKEALIMMVDTTQAQEKYLNSAIDDLHAEKDDWSLSDLADKIREGDRVRDDVANRVCHSISTLQDKGFIRDKKSDRLLDWEEIFSGSGTVKSFSAKFIEDKAQKQAFFAYILTKIRDERSRLASEDRLGQFPTATLVMRELQKLAPAGNKNSGNARRANATSVSRDVLRDIGEDMGHFHLEIIADSQKFTTQLDKDVRTHADRMYAFKGQLPDIQDVLKVRKASSEARSIASQVADYDVGECAVVHHHGVNWPIQAAPPRSMKLDSERYSSGFEARAEVLDDEETREIPWDTSLPERFKITDEPTSEDETTGEDLDDPVRKALSECTKRGEPNDDYIYKDYLRDILREHARENGDTIERGRDKLGGVIKRFWDFKNDDNFDDGQKRAGRDGPKTAYTGLVLTETGQELLEKVNDQS